MRKLGSAAIECAFTAAGLLRVARFAQPNMWDVAGGIVLVEAVGGSVREQADGGWRPLEPVTNDAIATWRRPLILGEAEAVTALIEARRG